SFKIVKTTIYTIVHGFSDILLTIDDLKNEFLEIGSTIIKPFKEIWGSDESFVEKLKKSLKEIPGTLITVGKGLIKGMNSTGNAIMGLIRPLGRVFFNLTGLAFELTMLLRRTFVKLRKAIVKKFLPSKWYEIYEKIEDRLTDIHFMSMNLMSSVLGSITSIGKTFKENVEEETEKGKKGIPLFFYEVVGTMKDTVMKAITPITSLLGNVWENIKSFGSMIKEMSEGPASKLKNFVSTFAEQVKTLGGNTKDFVLSIGKMTRDITEFSLAKLQKPVTAMAKGGLIYAANGIVVGEAGPEAVLPLDDPRATDRVAGMFSRALGKLGFTKDKTIGDNFQLIVINRLDTMINLLGGTIGKVEGEGILGKVAGSMTDVAISFAKLPFTLTANFFQGMGSAFKHAFGPAIGLITKGINVFGSTILTGLTGVREGIVLAAKGVGHTMSMGFKGLHHVLKAGFASLRAGLKAGWAIITAPFKAVGRFIMRPVQAIKDKYTDIKGKIKTKVKGVFAGLFQRAKGKDVVAVDKDGKPVYARWPMKIVSLLTQIKRILKKDQKIGGDRHDEELGFRATMKRTWGKIRGGLANIGGWFKKIWRKWILQGLMKAWSALKNTALKVPVMIAQVAPALATLGTKLSALAGPLGAAAAGLAGAAWMALDAFKGVKDARKMHDLKEGEKLKTSHKWTAGIGAALGGAGEGGLKSAALGAGKGALLGTGIGFAVGGPIGAAIGAGIGAIAGGILGAIGGKNIAKALQWVWKKIEKPIKAITNFILFPFKLIWSVIKKAKDFITSDKTPWEKIKALGIMVVNFLTWPNRMMLKGIKAAKDWVLEKVPGAAWIAEKMKPVVDLITWPFKKMMEILSAAKDWADEKIRKIPGIGKVYSWMAGKREEEEGELKPTEEGSSSWYKPWSWRSDKKEG
ncbi:MAG: hypothetical protein ACTSO3_16470, partial [Candidatus Heimdallarchaeaceae archaeon]